MNVRPNTRSLYGLTLFILALFLAVAPAHAEEVRGTFTLPNQVSWGNTVLPAGTYTYRVLSVGFPYTMRVEGNDGTNAILTATAWVPPNSTVADSLTMVKLQDGSYAVRNFNCKKLGLVFEYAVPTQANRMIANKKAPAHRKKLTRRSSQGS